MSEMANSLTLPKTLKINIKHLPIKRTFDIIFSLLALFILSPVYLAIALAIKISSKGKIVYAHQRVGRGAKSFQCFKFRTMYEDADKRLKEILEKNPELKKEWDTNHKLKNDPRVTAIGGFLRKTSLDELPQFWNVLIGDLSVVGPRPVVEVEVKKYFGMKAPKILQMRPGLTCYWAVSGRSDTSYEKRLELDEKYVENHSILLDIKLIMKTIPSMLNSKGAY